MCQETRRTVTKLHLEIVCSVCQNQRRENGVGMSPHVPIIGRISSSKSSWTRRKKQRCWERERRDRSLRVNFSIVPSFMVSTWFDGTSIGFRLPRWHQWLKKKKKSPANAGDTRDVGSIPGLGISPGVGNGHRPHNSCLEKMSTHTHTSWRFILWKEFAT